MKNSRGGIPWKIRFDERKLNESICLVVDVGVPCLGWRPAPFPDASSVPQIQMNYRATYHPRFTHNGH